MIPGYVPQKPRALKANDLIEVVTPASPTSPEKVEAGVKLLESQGYRVRIAPHAFDAEDYLAGTDQNRALDLQNAFSDPEVAAVYCARGGYGCGRLMRHVDFDSIANSGKMLIGFSDITVLHLALTRRGFPSLYAPMPLTFYYKQREPWVYESFLQSLRGNVQTPATAPTGKTVVGGKARGVVTGGCLCLLTDSLATPESLDCSGRILYIEDVDEHPHRVDAMLTHLLNAGQLDKACGFVVGEMTNTDDKVDEGIGARRWRDIVIERLKPLGKPTIIDYPSGHASQMLSIPLGIQAELDADQGTLRFLEDFTSAAS